MQLDVRSRDFPLTQYIRTHVERRVHSALDRVMPHISAVVVRLGDINGPRGGSDKQCGVVVQLVGGRTIVVRETDTCAYSAVDLATARMKRLVNDRLRERRDRRRGRDTIRDRPSGGGDGEAGAADLAA